VSESRPIVDPGSTISAGSSEGNSSFSINPRAHLRVRALTICVVVALVNSHTALPVSQ
jgi:hypothetical protein